MENVRGVLVSFSNRILGVSIGLAFMSAGILQAQESPTVPAPVPPPAPIVKKEDEQKTGADDQQGQKPVAPKAKDYGAGFEKFYKLGLPDASGAKYVKLDLYDFGGGSGMSGYMMRSMGVTGNAWMLKEDKAGKSLFIVDNCRLVELYDHETLSKLRAKEMEEKTKQGKDQKQKIIRFSYMDDGRTSGKWEAADLKKDLDRILELFNKKKGDDAATTNVNRNFEFDQMSRDGGYGTLLLTAIHAYKMGYKDEANQIAGKLFENAKEPQKVITQGMTVLADGRYNEIMDRFFAGGDWNVLGQELDGLLSTFPSGWRNAGAVKKLSDNVKKRAASSAPPELTDPRLKDEDKKLAVEISKADSSKIERFGYRGELWIMKAEKTAGRKAGTENLTEKITSRGMKSVPLLLDLLKDDYLTRIDLAKTRNYYSYSSSSSDASAEDRNNEIYQQMRRPASRADYAALLLRPILSNHDDYESRKEGPAGMFDSCSEWYEANKDKTPVELAKAYMADEDSSRKNEAIPFLIKNGSENDINDIEKYFLEADASDYSVIQLAQEFALERGEKAKDFAEKFINKLEKVKPEEANEEPGNDSMKKFNAEAIKNFKEAISSATVQDIIKEIISGKRSFGESMLPLSRKLQRESRENSEKILLSAALDAKDPETSLGFLQMISRGGPGGFAFAIDGESDEGDEIDYSTPTNMDLWKKLLADERKLRAAGDVNSNFGDAVASIIDSRYGGMSAPLKAKAMTVLSQDRVFPITKSRAAKILEGKNETELPKYPDPKDILADKRQKMLDEIKASSEPWKLLAGLSNDELMAVVEEADKKPEELAKFYASANKVKTVESEIPGLVKFDEVKAIEGKPLDKGTLEKILAICKSSASTGTDLSVQITRKGCLEGIAIRFLKIDDKGMNHLYNRSESVGYVSAWMNSRGDHSYLSANWPLDKEVKKAKDKNDGDLLEEAIEEAEIDMKDTITARQDEFWKGIGEWCAGKGNILYGADMYFHAISAKKQQEPEKKPEAAAGDKVKTIEVKEEKK